MFDGVSDTALVASIGDCARAENIACARRLAAIAELYDRRQFSVEDGNGRELWRVDPWEAVAAEVAAAQDITACAASALMHNAICLHQRLPKVAALFATGTISYRTVALIVARTLLALDPDVLAAIDAELAEALTRWGVLSRNKTEQYIDALIERHDPDARRRTETQARGRYVSIEHRGNGMAWLCGDLYSTDATLLQRRLTALAHTVCENDPRTIDQRCADAFGALAAGQTTLPCACGHPDCPAAESAAPGSVVVHVVAEQAALDAADTTELHGQRPGDGGPEIVTDHDRLVEIIREANTPNPSPPPAPAERSPKPGLTLGGPVIPAALLADLAARGIAELRPLAPPANTPPEPHYRPSKALADFIRCRDMTCRFPHCDRPAEFCDIDHTIRYAAGGLTHASNCKLLCRKHHLLKTFWTGATGWRDKQLPDGTVIWTSPSGRTYRTLPGCKLLIPALSVPTGTLLTPQPRSTGCTNRGAMMPTRTHTRATDRLRRILAERNHNARSRATS